VVGIPAPTSAADSPPLPDLATTGPIPTQSIGRGGVRLRAVRASGYCVDETRYPAELALAPHRHDHATLCVVLEGGLTERVGRHERSCGEGTLIVKPPGEAHSDRFHRGGARCVNVAIDEARLARLRATAPVLSETLFDAGPALWSLGRRLSDELRAADDVSTIAVEGLVLELVCASVRGARRRRARVPDWIEEIREYVHDNYFANVSLSEAAAAVGHHPAYVASCFRRRFGHSIGEYVRRLRVEHVARRLTSTRDPLARIAAEAGFADQSHMQRIFKARLGVTPAAYRRAHA